MGHDEVHLQRSPSMDTDMQRCRNESMSQRQHIDLSHAAEPIAASEYGFLNKGCESYHVGLISSVFNKLNLIKGFPILLK